MSTRNGSHRPRAATMDIIRADVRTEILDLLKEADGPTYDELCRFAVEHMQEAIARNWVIDPRSKPVAPSQTVNAQKWISRYEGVRVIRDLLVSPFVTIESDESCWLTPDGWKQFTQTNPVQKRELVESTR
jgi:hypothetical protein